MLSPLARDCRLSYISVMTEITKTSDRLPPAVERFVLKWGDMGSAWGVNRSVSQIHALLYLAGRPLTAEDIADSLGIARSNVSNSLKELMGWGLIRRVPIRGDRRDHFEAEGDIWELVTRIAIGRKAREIDPVVETLRACLADAQSDPRVDALAKKAAVRNVRVHQRGGSLVSANAELAARKTQNANEARRQGRKDPAVGKAVSEASHVCPCGCSRGSAKDG